LSVRLLDEPNGARYPVAPSPQRGLQRMMLIHVFILAGSPSHGRAWSWSGFHEVADEDSDKDEAVAFAAHAPRDSAGLPKKRASRPPGKTATHLFRPPGISGSIFPEEIS
jgi:hypothetical protein